MSCAVRLTSGPQLMGQDREVACMPGKSPLARAGWDVLFGVFCLTAAISVGETWQQTLLVVLGAAAVVYGIQTVRETRTG